VHEQKIKYFIELARMDLRETILHITPINFAAFFIFLLDNISSHKNILKTKEKV